MYRKTRQKLTAFLAAAFILSGSFPVITTHAETVPEEKAEDASEQTDKGNNFEQTETDKENDAGLEVPDEKLMDAVFMDAHEAEIPAEAPAFQAYIVYTSQGYRVEGTFTDFRSDMARIQIMYSLDGENWQACTENSDWDLPNLNTDREDHICLVSNQEPLAGYVAEKFDCFYLKLHITLKDGRAYDSKTAFLERGLLALPEDAQIYAQFPLAGASGSVMVPRPKYASCHLTVPADATAEEIAALLPETIPVEVQLFKGINIYAKSVIDCPVSWKPLSLTVLSPGETITIADAAEEITVPAGTKVSTPLGIFQLEETLPLISTDEVRLFLNVTSSESQNPDGVLKDELRTLKIALKQKPIGATSIRAYIRTEGQDEWTELSGLSLLEEFYQPSTPSTGYALLMRDDQEPYRSYLAAKEAGETPVPFYVSLKIEGGIYDGGEVILRWPDDYEQLSDLPKNDGSQGNEGNAGADNKADSTKSGQRPSLPQVPNGGQEKPQVPDPNESGEEQQSLSAIQETAPVTPEGLPSSSDGSVSDDASAGQKDHVLSGQRPNLPRIASDFSDADQENAPKLVPPVVQAAADTEETKNVMMTLSDPKAASEQAAKAGSRIPPLPIAVTATAAAVCIGVTVGKTAGYSFLRRIAGKILKVLHRIK